TVLSDAARTAIGDEEATTALQCVFSGSGGASDYELLGHRIEGVRRTSGKTLTVSFWAIAATGTPKVAIVLTQAFGSGGSPSGSVATAAQIVTLSTSWARYQATFTMPTVIGKTFGTTAGTDYVELQLFLSNVAGALGQQAGTITFWGQQVEFGYFATPFEKQEFRYDFTNCQRFYQTGAAFLGVYEAAGGGQLAAYVPFAVPMRAAPTVTITSQVLSNMSSVAPLQQTSTGFLISGVATAAANTSYNVGWTATADI
ncbi:MAG TPA: hypothetical protein VJ226_05120, partial [Bradyrhizobium sp.]|nr:hypothetical protein [Bradyrhizobium sp.]